MTLKYLLLCSFAATELLCMEATQVLDRNQGQALTSFPDYMYFYSAWSNPLAVKGLPIGKLATTSLYTAAQQIENISQKKEFINMCAALLVMEATILKKPFQLITLEDIQKIHALITHGLTWSDSNGQPKKSISFRTGRMWLQDNALKKIPQDARIAFKQIEESIDAHNEDDLELKEILTQEQYSLYKEFFVETPPAPKIYPLLQAMLASSQLVEKKTTPFSLIATNIHAKTTQIHPYDNGNGRLARLFTSDLLMQGGKFPFIVIDTCEYGNYIKLGDKDLALLHYYITESSKKAEQIRSCKESPYALQQGLASKDFSLVTLTPEYYFGSFQSIKEELLKHCYSQCCNTLPSKMLSPKDYQALLQTIARKYEAFSPETLNFEALIGDLKRFCLSSLGLSDTFCNNCSTLQSTIFFQLCSRCRKTFYCSKECQKKDWTVHKGKCKST